MVPVVRFGLRIWYGLRSCRGFRVRCDSYVRFLTPPSVGDPFLGSVSAFETRASVRFGRRLGTDSGALVRIPRSAPAPRPVRSPANGPAEGRSPGPVCPSMPGQGYSPPVSPTTDLSVHPYLLPGSQSHETRNSTRAHLEPTRFSAAEGCEQGVCPLGRVGT